MESENISKMTQTEQYGNVISLKYFFGPDQQTSTNLVKLLGCNFKQLSAGSIPPVPKRVSLFCGSKKCLSKLWQIVGRDGDLYSGDKDLSMKNLHSGTGFSFLNLH